MADGNLNDKEEAFCEAIAKYGEKAKVKAYEEAGYSMNMSKAAIAVQADKIFNRPKISLKIKELRSIVKAEQEKAFKYTIDWRLEKLEEIINAGLSTYIDSAGNERREGLAAAKGSIDTMNSMLGVSDDEDDTGQAMTINFQVSPAVKEVKVVNGG